ncbi:hypothetical protein [Nonomuraea ceibae]|uniref:hypothetical protein n=1 Tax=Nonomuraea ceibae TaxID=1935170 RepID=UPI001C5DC6B1|nr:hypothetical protein [Nonomuraea ceibae]
MAAGKILNDFEANGRAQREPGVSEGGRGRAADRWFPITPEPVTNTVTDAVTDADADADAEPTGTADAPVPAPEMPDAAPEGIIAPGTDADTPEVDAVPAPGTDTAPAAIGSADSASADEPIGEEDLIASEASGQDSGGADGDLDVVTEADQSGPVSVPVADDPAWARAHAELAELVDLFGGVISAKDEGNAVMALGCLEMAMTKVASAHRNARAALTGNAAPARAVSAARPGAGSGAGAGDAVRPGALRDMVYAHLVEFPGKDFTPYEIGKVINRSSGAVANALDRLVSLGEAVLTCERPRRFGLAPTAKPTLAAPAAKPTPAAPADTHDPDVDEDADAA